MSTWWQRFASPVRRVAVAIRRLLLRHAAVYWAVVCLLAFVAWGALNARAAELDDTREAWGETIRVVVADTMIQPGQPIANDVSEMEVPLAIAPERALRTAELPDARAVRTIAGGAIVTSTDVAIESGPLAIAPPGWVAVSMLADPPPPASIGSPVMIVAEGVVLAADAIVVAADHGVWSVALPESDAPSVAYAASQQHATIIATR